MSGTSNLRLLDSGPFLPSQVNDMRTFWQMRPAVLPSDRMATSVLVLDLDGVMRDTAPDEAQHYWPQLYEITDKLGLDRELVRECHNPKIKRRVRGIEYLIVECAAEQRLDIEEGLLLEAVHKYNAIHSGQQIPSCSGVAETLPRIREQFPGTAIVVFTQCLNWMAPARLSRGDTNLLQYIDGIVGVRPVPPVKSTQHAKYRQGILASTQWLNELYAAGEESCRHLILEWYLPYEQTKPERYALEWIAAWAKVPLERAVFVGNEAIDQQCAIAANWPNFVWARYGASPDTNLPELPAHIIDAFDELPAVLEKHNF